MEWGTDEENASQMKRKGMACATGVLNVVPAGMGEGRKRGDANVDDMGQGNTISCKRAPPVHCAKAALINDSSSPATVPT